jgi:hypothetical protein
MVGKDEIGDMKEKLHKIMEFIEQTVTKEELRVEREQIVKEDIESRTKYFLKKEDLKQIVKKAEKDLDTKAGLLDDEIKVGT